VLLKFLRLSNVVAEAIVYSAKDQQLNDLIAISHEVDSGGNDINVDFLFLGCNF
jgi:hypothetical protein